jgi:hypothetical protein
MDVRVHRDTLLPATRVQTTFQEVNRKHSKTESRFPNVPNSVQSACHRIPVPCQRAVAGLRSRGLVRERYV